MSTIKTTITADELQEVLKVLEISSKPAIITIASGELSQAFELDCDDQSLILRVNDQTDLGFWKDAYAYENFSAAGLRIPRIISNGKLGRHFYSLSEKCRGVTLNDMDVAGGKLIAPDMFRQLCLLYSPIPKAFL